MTTEIANLPAAQKKAALAARAAEARRKLATTTPTATPSAGGHPRLLFAMDATASREPSWRTAQEITATMFLEVPDGLEVALAYYQGHDTFKASSWTSDPVTFGDQVAAVRCASGVTQIAKVLQHAVAETARGRLAAVVLVGDAWEDNLEGEIAAAAAHLRTLGVKLFAFFEGDDITARRNFAALVDAVGGALLPFDQTAPDQLRELLAGIAAYASGGLPALEAAAQKRLPAARMLLGYLKS